MDAHEKIETALNLLQRAQPVYPYTAIIDGVIIEITEPPLWVKELRKSGITVHEGAWM